MSKGHNKNRFPVAQPVRADSMPQERDSKEAPRFWVENRASFSKCWVQHVLIPALWPDLPELCPEQAHGPCAHLSETRCVLVCSPHRDTNGILCIFNTLNLEAGWIYKPAGCSLSTWGIRRKMIMESPPFSESGLLHNVPVSYDCSWCSQGQTGESYQIRVKEN